MEQGVNNDTCTLTQSLQDNLQLMRDVIGHSPDVNIRQFQVGSYKWPIAVVYIEGLVDKEALQEQVIKQLMNHHAALEEQAYSQLTAEQMERVVMNTIISLPDVKEADQVNDVILAILSGNTALFLEGTSKILLLGTAGGENRAINEPMSEAVVRGPRDGFVESISQNKVLIRRRIKDPSFTMVPYKLGRRSQTDVLVLYMKGLTNPDLLDEVKRRIEQINIDDILESGYVEQLIEDNYLSLFPQVQSTERPDRVVAALMEGRVAILVDGTPFALIVPVTFSMLMVSPEDYYERWVTGSLIRFMRYCAAFVALFLPSIYIALVSFNHGLIPTKLVISIAAGREGVPFPSLLEALVMEVTLEVLREAGVRLPKPVGQSVSIVGGLVIGQSAVQAGIVSPIMVIVVSLTAIASFSLPQYEAGIAIRILRFVSMLFAAIFGIYGIILFFIFVTVHTVKLKSFGVPYSAPFAPYIPTDWKDVMIRFPLRFMKERPKVNKPQDPRRQG